MGEPIGQGHTQPGRWEEPLAALSVLGKGQLRVVPQRGRWEEPLAVLSVLGKGQLRAVPQRGRWEEPLAARQPEQIRSNAEERERGAAPNPDEGSRAIGSRFARTPDHTGCENTTDQCLVQ